MNIYEHIHEQTGLPYGAVKDHLYRFLDELQAYITGESDYPTAEAIADDYFIPYEYLHRVVYRLGKEEFTISLPAPTTEREYNQLLRRVKSYSNTIKCPEQVECSECINMFICDFFERLAAEVESKVIKPKK